MSLSVAQHDALIRIAFGSITGSYAAIGSVTDAFGLIILNSLDKEVSLSLDGANAWLNLDAGESPVLNYNAMGKIFPKSTFQIKHLGSAPTAGSLRICSIRRAPPNF